MHNTWAQFFYDWWWTVLPILWFVWSAYRSYLQYLYRRRKLEVLANLAQSGKEISPDVVRLLQTDDGQAKQYTRHQQWRQVILFGTLAIGFELAHYLNPALYRGFDFVAIMLGCVAVSYLLYLLTLRKPDAK